MGGYTPEEIVQIIHHLKIQFTEKQMRARVTANVKAERNNCGIIFYCGKLYINIIRNIREDGTECMLFKDLMDLGIDMDIEDSMQSKRPRLKKAVSE